MQIGEIEKNSREVIRVTDSMWGGHRFIDLRIYYKNDLDRYLPSRKGVTLSIQTIRKVIEFLKQGAEHLEDGCD